MEKKKLIVGSSIIALSAAVVLTSALAFHNSTTMAAADSTYYTAEMSSTNKPIITSNNSFDYSAFRLHGGEEYGLLYLSVTEDIDLSDDNYAFAWTNKTGRHYFEIDLETRTQDIKRTIDGKQRILRGFPGANTINVFYRYGDPSNEFDLEYTFHGGQGWNVTYSDASSPSGPLRLLSAVKDPNYEGDYAKDMTFSIEGGIVKITRFSIGYYC